MTGHMNSLKKIIVFCLIVVATKVWAAPLNQTDFTRHFLDQAKLTLKDVEFTFVRPLQVNSKNVNGFELTVFLDNSYTQYLSSPDNLKNVIGSHLVSIRTSHELLASGTGKSIFPVIKPADYLATVKKQLQQAGIGNNEVPLVYRKFNDDLYVFYVFDSTNGVRMVTKKDMVEIKVDESAIHQIALKNLAEYFEQKALQVKRLDKIPNAKIYTVTIDQFYEASSLLLSKYWTSQVFDVRGEIVVFVPARNTVVVTGSNDKEGMRIATYLAETGFRELGYAISPKAYRYDNGSWKAALP